MFKAGIVFSAACLFAIGCYVMFKPDLTDLGFIPVVATNPETASEFRSLFAGSFIAYAYLLMRFIYSYNSQCNGRYENEIFSSVSVSTVNYCDVYIDGEHEMDIYTPDGDTETSRPVVLYLHGGAFYGGDKILTDCVDFCTSMAKKGYVAISANYRLNQNPVAFIYSQEEQFRTVLKAISDIKASIRYLRKDNATGNALGIDPNAIFVGGYSAGAVLSIHLAYIDQISDMPTSPINVQNLIANIGGTLEGDGGNVGYSSAVNGVFSFAGAINDLNFDIPN